MPDLTFEVAQRLASSLVTIGHPYQAAAIEATAWDLVKWCHGVIAGRQVVTPEQQAQALVDHAREQWEDGWPEKGGTKRLHGLFREMFPDTQDKPWEPASADQLQQRGLLAARCEHCPPESPFCEYGGPRAHKRYLEEQQYIQAHQEEKKPRRAPLIQLTAGEFQSRAAAFYRDEQKRKGRQVADVDAQQSGRAS